MLKGTISILGTPYRIDVVDKKYDLRGKEADGLADFFAKIIYIFTDSEEHPFDTENIPAYYDKVLKHEIVHCFMYESGLDNQEWARNEILVDWIAVQLDKLSFAFKDAKECIYEE